MKKDLIGQRFGKLTVIKKLGRLKKNRRVYWLCLCDCGKEKSVGSNALSCTASCGCSRGRWKYSGSDAALQHLFIAYKHSARTRKLTFDLSLEDFKLLTSSNCVYCGTPPSSVHRRPGGVAKVAAYIFNGIDRIKNEQGYVSENCASCCGLCNYMKRNQTKDNFLAHAKKIFLNMGI